MFKENGYEKHEDVNMDGKMEMHEHIKISRMNFEKKSREEYIKEKEGTDRIKHFYEGNISEPC
jgi:hypothetical protein